MFLIFPPSDLQTWPTFLTLISHWEDKPMERRENKIIPNMLDVGVPHLYLEFRRILLFIRKADLTGCILDNNYVCIKYNDFNDNAACNVHFALTTEGSYFPGWCGRFRACLSLLVVSVTFKWFIFRKSNSFNIFTRCTFFPQSDQHWCRLRSPSPPLRRGFI